MPNGAGGEVDLRERVRQLEEGYGESFEPPERENYRYYLARVVVWGFAGTVLLVTGAILLSIYNGTFEDDYLVVLSTIGSIWGGLTGAIIGFYFGGPSTTDEL